MNDKNSAFFIGIWVTIAFVVTGCSSFNPYQRSDRLDMPLATLTQGAKIPPEQDKLAGYLDGALDAVKHQRQEWFDSLSTQSRVRAGAQLTIIGVTAAALYHGLKSGVAGRGETKRLALPGALGAATFVAGDWYVNTSHEQAYIDGISGLTCKMLLIEPFRMTQTSLSSMASQQQALTGAIDALDLELLKAGALHRYDEKDNTAQAKVRIEARQALYRGRTTLTASEQLYRAVDTSGVILLREADLVVASIADKLRSSHKNVNAPRTTVESLSSIIGQYKAVTVDAKVEKEASDSPKNPQDKKNESDMKPPDEAAASKNAAVPSAVAKAAKVSEAAPQVLIDELLTRLQKQHSTALTAADRKMSAQVKAAAEASEQAKRSAMQAAASAQRGLDYCKQSGRTDCMVTADDVATLLAVKTATLYQSRRPLSNRLLTFDDAVKAARSNRACVGAGSTMTVAPNTDANVQAGAIYALAVNGAIARPNVVIKGNASQRTYLGQGHQYIVEVSVSEEASGLIDIAISDASFTEEIRLTVAAKTP